MAQTLTVSVLRGDPNLDAWAGGIHAHQSPLTLSLDWLSAVGGTVSLGIATSYSEAMPDRRSHPQPTKVRGRLMRVDTIPDTGGTKPDINYAVSLLDANGVDLAAGGLVDRSDVTTETIGPFDSYLVDDEITLTITGAGDGNGGTIILYLVP